MDSRTKSVRGVLKKLYRKYNRYEFISPDPLQFVYRYSKPLDMEIAALLSAVLAYGNVKQIGNSLEKLLGMFGDSPADYVLKFTPVKKRQIKDFKHRFTTAEDISDLLTVLKVVLRKFGSLENLFLDGYQKTDENIIPALTKFCSSLIDIHKEQNSGRVNPGLSYLLASPVRKSACKRLNMFLRWMVRSDDVDAGLWGNVDSAKLIVPVDVHMARLCRILGLYERKTADLKAAVEITNSFKKIEPNDPVMYDFSLSRVGIVENCTGKKSKSCEYCELRQFCGFVTSR